MPLPVLFIGAAAISSGVFGAGKTVKAVVDNSKARAINEIANESVRKAEEKLENQRSAVSFALNELGELKLNILQNSVTEFLNTFEQIKNVDFTESFEREINGNAVGNVSNESSGEGSSNSSSDNTASGLGINSDTPQGQINKQSILNGQYASKTNADESESHIEDETNTQTSSTSSTDSTSQTKTVESSTLHKTGNDGSLTTVQNLIKQFRGIIDSTDEKIINELNSLFMGIY